MWLKATVFLWDYLGSQSLIFSKAEVSLRKLSSSESQNQLVTYII